MLSYRVSGDRNYRGYLGKGRRDRNPLPSPNAIAPFDQTTNTDMRDM
ncbi:hypothetical protein [Coleofasciculus sp.]